MGRHSPTLSPRGNRVPLSLDRDRTRARARRHRVWCARRGSTGTGHTSFFDLPIGSDCASAIPLCDKSKIWASPAPMFATLCPRTSTSTTLAASKIPGFYGAFVRRGAGRRAIARRLARPPTVSAEAMGSECQLAVLYARGRTLVWLFSCRELVGMPPQIFMLPLLGHTLGHCGWQCAARMVGSSTPGTRSSSAMKWLSKDILYSDAACLPASDGGPKRDPTGQRDTPARAEARRWPRNPVVLRPRRKGAGRVFVGPGGARTDHRPAAYRARLAGHIPRSPAGTLREQPPIRPQSPTLGASPIPPATANHEAG